MEITTKSRNQLRLQNIVFIILFSTIIGLLAWLSSQYNFEADWTDSNRNTLSDASIKLLEQIPAAVKITTFIPDGNLAANRQYISELVSRYQKYKADITLEIINPDIEPDLVRQLKVSNYGEVVVEYQGRNEHIEQLQEETLTNTLQRLLRQGERRLLFVSGHGERNPDGHANFDWNQFSSKLKIKGITTELLRLNETPNIPDVAAVVIASPQVDFLAGEVKLIIDYVKRGGNLLWLNDPGNSLYGLQPLADLLGIEFYPGTIVDPTAQIMNVKDPSFSIVTNYPDHTITRDFQYISIFPKAVGIIHNTEDKNWFALPFLQTVPRSWSETGVLKGAVDYNADEDFVGPLTIGLSLTRKDNEKNTDAKTKKQRIVVLGDGDFLSNTYLGNQGNLNLGHNIINWVSNDDDFIAIPSSSAVDTQLTISGLMGGIIGLFFLIILPLTLLIAGTYIWYKRRSA
ncbi:MAG: GldG family protein [Gammaproteobacteria bacterium]|nr:GldG family protein [Gammaproteobacteria bacterium]MCW8988371.1 GldG family protein [Gammaproteobacteria bacterium]